MGDVFEDRPDLQSERIKLFKMIQNTPHLEWQLLTKRPENMTEMLLEYFGDDLARNIWLGVSAENQRYFDERWPILERVGRRFNAKILFLSLEPLLAPIDLHTCLESIVLDKEYNQSRKVDWVITGGESGRVPRTAHPAWFRSIRDQCNLHSVPFFFKQWGEWYPCKPEDFPASKHTTFTDPVAGTQHFAFIGKTKAGAVLDGEEYKEFPEYEE